MAMARATSVRIDSSSSAIRTRGIERPSSASAARYPCSCVAAGDVPPAEEADIDIAAFRGRRSQAGLEPGSFAWIEHGLLQHGIPSVDLGPLPVPNSPPHPNPVWPSMVWDVIFPSLNASPRRSPSGPTSL